MPIDRASVLPDSRRPYTTWATVTFLVLVVVMMGFSGGTSMIAVLLIPVIAIALAVGWRLVSRRRAS